MEIFLILVFVAVAWWWFARRSVSSRKEATLAQGSVNNDAPEEDFYEQVPDADKSPIRSSSVLEKEVKSVAPVAPFNSSESAPISSSSTGFTVTFTSSLAGWDNSSLKGPPTPAELSAVNSNYASVMTKELPELSPSEQWWNPESKTKYSAQGSDKAISWLEPFVPLEIAKKLTWRPGEDNWGPWQLSALSKEIRVLIRQHRKDKVPHPELLNALYGVNVLSSFLSTLNYEHLRAKALAGYLAGSEVRSVKCDYSAIGYKHIESLGVTDVKWLVAAFGEPQSHLSGQGIFPVLNERAISRYLWSELRRRNQGSGPSAMTMTELLVNEKRLHLQIAKDSQARRVRADIRDAYAKVAQTKITDAVAATHENFIVAELGTSGRDWESDEIKEFSALEVNSSGQIVDEYYVSVSMPEVPCISLADALKGFKKFVGNKAIFVFNGYIPEGFLRKACQTTHQKQLENPIYDVMELASEALPRDSLTLANLAQDIGLPAPEYTASARARAMVAVLMDSSKTIQKKQKSDKEI